jgi:hypothetical protein
MSEPGDRASKWIWSMGAQAVNVVEGQGTSPENGRGDGAPAGVQGVRRVQKSFDRKLGDLEGASPLVVGGRQSRESDERHAVTVALEKSDEAIVPEKSAKMRVTPFESMEGRAEAKGSSAARNAPSTQSETSAATGMQRVRQGAPCVAGRQLDAVIQAFYTIARGWLLQFEWRPTRRSASYASDPRWEPGAGNPLAGFCPGGGVKTPSLPERRQDRSERLVAWIEITTGSVPQPWAPEHLRSARCSGRCAPSMFSASLLRCKSTR